ncbi:MAG: MFS transporter, partial [Bdellovibrionota bacterium]
MTSAWNPYQIKLFFMLSVASFFEGFDLLALTQILPSVREEFGISPSGAGVMVAVISVGTVLSYALVQASDRYGRRPVMLYTVIGYTVFSALTGLAPDAITFTAMQLVARVFLITEWALATIYAAEEFPAHSRGKVIGLIQGVSSIGAIVCAACVPLLLQTPLGWRSVYFVGTVPLLFVVYARRGLRDTHRFLSGETRLSEGRASLLPSMSLLRSAYRFRVGQLALMWATTYAGTQAAITFWKEFATAERSFSDAEVGQSIALAAVVSMPLVLASGALLDRIGRKKGALVIYAITALGIFGSFTCQSKIALTLSLILSLFGASAVLPVLNAYTTELFPTHLRGQAFA